LMDLVKSVNFRIPFPETPDVTIGKKYRLKLVPIDGDT